MVGHKLWQRLQREFQTYATIRGGSSRLQALKISDAGRLICHVNTCDFDSVVNAVRTVRPDVVINCIGVVKQCAESQDPVTAIGVNALFPHRLARLAGAAGARFITLSTDCVFSGKRGAYSELDTPDATDLYGRSKLLGEVQGEGCLTLRTSVIGRQLENNYGLIEWFLSQEGKTIKGFTKAIFSGLTTHALAEIIAEIIENHGSLHGVWHMASEPISKYALLNLVRDAINLSVDIIPDDTFVCDRSLDGSRLHAKTGIAAPSWPVMIERLFKDPTPYEQFRKSYACG